VYSLQNCIAPPLADFVNAGLISNRTLISSRFSRMNRQVRR
jgi:hypothetical protein